MNFIQEIKTFSASHSCPIISLLMYILSLRSNWQKIQCINAFYTFLALYFAVILIRAMHGL